MKVDVVNLQYYYNIMAQKEVRSKIVRARSEIIATGQFSDYIHRFGDFSYQKQSSFNSSYISGLISDEMEKLTKEMKEKTAKIC